MPRVLLVDDLEPEAAARLHAAATVVSVRSGDDAALRGLIGDCDALVARTYTPVDRALLEAGRRLRVVGVVGAGIDRVDLDAARALGIQVVSTPDAASDAVADLTLALILQLLRPVARLADEYRRGRFSAARQHPHGHELRDLTIGVVGMGRIGSRVGRRCAAGFGARVLYNDIVDVGPFDFPATAVTKEQIWAASDIVTLHVPLTPLTKGLMSSAVLAQLKPTAFLVNTARGAAVDTQALTEALLERRIAGAALDVTDPEPLPPNHTLFACTSCLLTPHIAARTHGGWRRMCAVVDEVLRILRETS